VHEPDADPDADEREGKEGREARVLSNAAHHEEKLYQRTLGSVTGPNRQPASAEARTPILLRRQPLRAAQIIPTPHTMRSTGQ
jgi:hypothetical protein